MTSSAYAAWNLIAGLAAGAFCVYAGIYLVRSETLIDEASYLQTIAHGLGWYMIGKGIFVAVALGLRGLAPSPSSEAGQREQRPERHPLGWGGTTGTKK